MTDFWGMATYFLYLAAAVSALVLALWQSRSRFSRLTAIRTSSIALSASALWSFSVLTMGFSSLLAQMLMGVTYLAWLWMVYCLFARDDRVNTLAPIRPVALALALVELLHGVILFVAVNYQGQSEALYLFERFAVMLRLLFCIGALVLVHNLYAGAAAEVRQSLRWPTSAMALLWLYDLNYYTIAYLVHEMPFLLGQLRSAALLSSLALLAIGMLRHDDDRKFGPSRSFAFQSFSLFLIGAYLTMMVVASQGIAYAGSDYSKILQTGFILTASGAVLVAFLSPKLRGWSRVMISKHLFQHRYDYRSEWLRFNQTIGRAGLNSPAFTERVVQALADITDSPSGLLLVTKDEGGLELAGRWQWNDIEVPNEAICAGGAAFFEERKFIVDLDQIRSGKEKDVPEAAYPDWMLEDESAWAIVPLIHYERMVGLAVLARPPVSRQLDWEDFDLLRVVGSQLASYLAEQSSQDALSEAQRFDDFNRRMAFVMHDIKNLASQLSLLARNSEKHAEKPEFRADMILTLRNSTDKLQALLDRLGRYGAQGTGDTFQVNLNEMAERIAQQYAGKHQLNVLATEPCFALAEEESLEQALVHLVQNAIEASKNTEPVVISLTKDQGEAMIEVADTGSGMNADFIRTKLFKPFHSSKPAGFGIGAFEARELIRGMGGKLEVQSREGLGTKFQIHLPFANSQQIKLVSDENKSKVA